MIFLSYWFWAFAAVFFALYWSIRIPAARAALLVVGCLAFQLHFAGVAGALPMILLGILVYCCGIVGGRTATAVGIAGSVAVLAFYKYLVFLAESVIGFAFPGFGATFAVAAKGLLPEIAPLGISFFVFEFVHYLFDVRRGQPAIRSPTSFALFGLFWPSLVAGPIKRYQQFLPALGGGLQSACSTDVAVGLLRIAAGLLKKFSADYLGQIIHSGQDQFAELSIGSRWALLLAIALRILFDFSGYSDMAIGFARMMGIRLPENFRWPYLATTPAGFWRRWHISLSSWIRDYVYIPLGGGRLGQFRRAINALIAFALFGLWHGASWNFVLWGLYHGLGLTASRGIEHGVHRIGGRECNIALRWLATCAAWCATMLFVAIGWLLFFYPLPKALEMARLLFWPI